MALIFLLFLFHSALLRGRREKKDTKRAKQDRSFQMQTAEERTHAETSRRKCSSHQIVFVLNILTGLVIFVTRQTGSNVTRREVTRLT